MMPSDKKDFPSSYLIKALIRGTKGSDYRTKGSYYRTSNNTIIRPSKSLMTSIEEIQELLKDV